MLKDGALLALALCCIVSFRHGNPCLPTCLGRWRSDSSEDLTDLTARFEWLHSDPVDLAVAIAMYAMFLEIRPSRTRWQLLFQHRHVVGACVCSAATRCLQICFFCMEPNYKLCRPLLRQVRSCFGLLAPGGCRKRRTTRTSSSPPPPPHPTPPIQPQKRHQNRAQKPLRMSTPFQGGEAIYE